MKGELNCTAVCMGRSTLQEVLSAHLQYNIHTTQTPRSLILPMQAVQAVRMDMLRSLYARVSALADGIEDQRDAAHSAIISVAKMAANSSKMPMITTAPPSHHITPIPATSLPIRVALPLSPLLNISNYVFADEDNNVCRVTFGS